jgi:hypothetical protein
MSSTGIPPRRNPVGDQVDFGSPTVSDFGPSAGRAWATAADRSADPRLKFCHAKRLGDVVIG